MAEGGVVVRVGIDMQTTLGQKTGFGYYVLSLVNGLQGLNQGDLLLIKPETEKDFSTAQRLWWDQVVFPKKALKDKADIIHQPCFSAPLRSGKAKVIVTVHDLIALLYGEDIPFYSRMFFGQWMPFTYRFADKIISISEHTKNDLVKILKVPEEKIVVIPEAASEEYRPIEDKKEIEKVKERYQINGEYFLHVGTLSPRKNLTFLVEVFSQFLKSQKDQDYKLVITGKKGWYYEDLFQKVADLGIQDKVVFTGYISDEDKPALYCGAKIFLFPSLYEGFGLPPLEAMSCGTPVISSNTSSLPEVVGDAGILLPPKALDEWAQNILEIVQNPSRHKELAEAGLKRAKNFSWQKTAEATIKIYEEVIAENEN